MANVGKILGVSALLGILAYGGYKGATFYNKIKQAAGNITFNVSFSRVHGLVGEGLTKFISPTIRAMFNLNLKNFSGFDIEVTRIFARVDTQKAGSNDWATIATTTEYMNINLKDGNIYDKTLTLDFKGFGTITSIIDKQSRHRIVLTYNYKGQQLQNINDVDLTSPINSFWQKAKSTINSLKGINTLELLG